jgi:hypothetical protein
VPFRTRPGQPRDLLALIEDEVRERITEAVDSVSLEVMVRRRRQEGLPEPVADSARDREEFDAGVGAFLERLRAELLPTLSPSQRKAVEAASRAGSGPLAGLLGLQVILARELPDYWQRFEVVRLAFTGERGCRAG